MELPSTARLVTVSVCCSLLTAIAGCALLAPEPVPDNGPAILRVYDDGTMRLGDRAVSPADVVIYPDGFGGEKAALRLRVPLHEDYYRDSIIVERLAAEPQQSVN